MHAYSASICTVRNPSFLFHLVVWQRFSSFLCIKTLFCFHRNVQDERKIIFAKQSGEDDAKSKTTKAKIKKGNKC